MTSPRKKPTSAGFWITVALVAVLVGYPLSFGPVCWALDHFGTNGDMIAATYRPLLWLVVFGPAPVSGPILDYANLYTHDNWTVDPVIPDFVRCRRASY
jgi:hypothetical protein